MKMSDLELLLPEPAAEPLLVPKWGVVTQAAPLRVRLDGDDAALPVDPSSLVSGLAVGDRAFCLLAGRQLVVVGANRFGGDPAGVVKEFAGSVAPEGWLLCNGQAVSRTTYARLFAVVGEFFGGGDGSTTFNLPNRSGRVAVGVDPTQPEFNVLGKTGGYKVHILTVDQMPAHTHGQYVSANEGHGGPSTRRDFVADVVGALPYPQGLNTDSAGGGQPHNNLQPYIAMNFIIKT